MGLWRHGKKKKKMRRVGHVARTHRGVGRRTILTWILQKYVGSA